MKLALIRKMALVAIALTCGTATAASPTPERINELVKTRCSVCHGPTGQSSNA